MSADMVLRPGELVDITIRAARVNDARKSWPENSNVVFLADVWVDFTDAEVDVARVAPAEWPPKVGDLWRDRDGVLWFATMKHGPTSVWLTNGGSSDTSHSLLGDRGPLTLVHREPRYQNGPLVNEPPHYVSEPE